MIAGARDATESPSNDGDDAKDRFCILFGDVSGKGIPGAMIMCRLAGAAHAIMRVNEDPAQAVTTINAHMSDRMVGGRFVTMVLFAIDSQTHEFHLVNAGHNSPFLRRADGTVVIMDDSAGGLPIGIDGDYQYESLKGTLQPGESLVMYTDGIDEAMRTGRECYGTERMASAIAQAKSPTAIGQHLVDDVREFVSGYPQSDDISVVTVTRTK